MAAPSFTFVRGVQERFVCTLARLPGGLSFSSLPRRNCATVWGQFQDFEGFLRCGVFGLWEIFGYVRSLRWKMMVIFSKVLNYLYVLKDPILSREVFWLGLFNESGVFPLGLFRGIPFLWRKCCLQKGLEMQSGAIICKDLT